MKAWRLIAGIIEDGKKSGEFRADADSEVAARLLVSGLVTQLVWQYQAGGIPGIRVGHRRLIHSAIDLCLAALHPAGSP